MFVRINDFHVFGRFDLANISAVSLGHCHFEDDATTIYYDN